MEQDKEVETKSENNTDILNINPILQDKINKINEYRDTKLSGVKGIKKFSACARVAS